MKQETSNLPQNEAMPYDTLLCPVDLFRYFVRKQYENVKISNEDIDGLRVEFAKYLHKLDLNDKQKENTLPKSTFDVILNAEHPFKMHGFEAAYVFHFATFIEKMQEEARKQGYSPNGA